MKLQPRLLIPIFILLLFFGAPVFGQDLKSPHFDCHINRISQVNRSAEITITISAPSPGKTVMQFIDQFAGVDRLTERVHSLKVTDAHGSNLPLEIRGNGLYIFNSAQQPGSIRVSYEMRLARALDPSQYALVSSIGADAAMLMMADLLPRVCFNRSRCDEAKNEVRLRVTAPENWQIVTTEPWQESSFHIDDAFKATFFLGRLKTRLIKKGNGNLRIAIAGERNFRDEEVFQLAEAIAMEQASMIGSLEKGDFLVALAPFPQPLTGLRSSAITVGRTAFVLLNTNNDADQSFKHYRKHLAHEMFHFYLPNAFRIRENFDWFWEGFTRYMALTTLARLRMIDLHEYLDAISAEYEAYLFNPARLQLSLVAASPEKFANAASYDLVYHKGMLVAALYDLQLCWQSRGKLRMADAVKTLYQDYAVKGQEAGNQEVLEVLAKFGDFSQFIRDDILGTREINLAERVKTYGLRIEQTAATNGRAKLRTVDKLSLRQRELFSTLTTGTKQNP